MRKTPWMCRYQKRLQGCVLIPGSSCLSPPVRVTWTLLLNPHKMPHGYCLTAPLQLLCFCLGLLETSALRRSCYFITSHFKRASLLSWTFLSVLLFCYLGNVSLQQFLPGSWSRERMQLQIGPLPKVIVFLPPVVTPSYVQDTYFAHLSFLKGQILICICLRRIFTLPSGFFFF